MLVQRLAWLIQRPAHLLKWTQKLPHVNAEAFNSLLTCHSRSPKLLSASVSPEVSMLLSGLSLNLTFGSLSSATSLKVNHRYYGVPARGVQVLRTIPYPPLRDSLPSPAHLWYLPSTTTNGQRGDEHAHGWNKRSETYDIGSVSRQQLVEREQFTRRNHPEMMVAGLQ